VKDHIKGCTYNSTTVSGITPEQWTTFQCLAGDSSDNIAGAEGIGAKFASDLVKEFGTVEAIIQAAKDEDDRITEKKRQALIEFESRYETTMKLVTLITDLELPTTTRII
jgi:DNA polymerase-1